MKRTRTFLIFAVLVAAAWAAVHGILRLGEEEFHGDEFRRPAPDFSLTDHRDRAFSLSDHEGKVVLLNFGFTNCPDICPATLGVLGGVLDLLGEKSGRVAAVFVTVDPQRDTVERLGGFIPFFHEDIIGLTGTESDIREMSLGYGVSYFREEAEDGEGYLVGHPTSVYLINRRGEMILRYAGEKLDPEKIADDIRRLL